MILAQAPAVPDISALNGLNPAVAVALLIFMALIYLGPEIKAKVRSKNSSNNPPAAPPTPTPDPLPGPIPALNRAEQVSQQFVDYLLRQIEQAAEREEDLERRNVSLERENQQLNQENRRLETMLWQRNTYGR